MSTFTGNTAIHLTCYNLLADYKQNIILISRNTAFVLEAWYLLFSNFIMKETSRSSYIHSLQTPLASYSATFTRRVDRGPVVSHIIIGNIGLVYTVLQEPPLTACCRLSQDIRVSHAYQRYCSALQIASIVMTHIEQAHKWPHVTVAV